MDIFTVLGQPVLNMAPLIISEEPCFVGFSFPHWPGKIQKTAVSCVSIK